VFREPSWLLPATVYRTFIGPARLARWPYFVFEIFVGGFVRGLKPPPPSAVERRGSFVRLSGLAVLLGSLSPGLRREASVFRPLHGLALIGLLCGLRS
jgi:hypothetical protein